MGPIKDMFSDHPVLGVASTLFFGVQITTLILKFFYNSFEEVPATITNPLMILFAVSLPLFAIGGFLSIGKQAGASGVKQYLSVFFKGYWASAKWAICITAILLACMGLHALALAILY